MAWSITVRKVVIKALEICGVLDPGEEPTAEDYNTALDALNGLLKELPIHGFSTAKLQDTETALTWSSGTPGYVALPADYAGVPSLWYTDANGKLQPVSIIDRATWLAVADRTATGTYPTDAYISPDDNIYLYPVPTADPSLQFMYRAAINEKGDTLNPDVKDYWHLSLPWGVADEISVQMRVPQAMRVEINQRWMAKRAKLIAYDVNPAPIRFEVAD